MAAEGICTRESTAAAPVAAPGKVTAADEFLFARVQALVALAVVLTSEGFAADCTDKWSFVGVGAEMRAQVVCSSEPLRA
jgi:hypothetical protein